MTHSDTNPRTLVGTRFGRYEVEARIAAGGMAEVWRARLTGSAGFEKRVALKTLLPNLTSSEELTKMFIGEAALAAELSHPNVVQIYDFGCKDGHYFMAMEYVPGRSLRQLLQGSQQAGARHLPRWALLEMALQACDGLEHIHAFHDGNGQPMGLVHRDVSPENILISWQGAVKIIDFGVARVVEAAGAASGPVAGKPRYMAPEQALGMDVDARADVFSLGVVLYACVTGRLPFAGKNAQEVMEAVVSGRCPPLAKLDPTAAPLLIRAVERAMATDRGDRTPDMASLRRDLLTWARAENVDPLTRQLGKLAVAMARNDDDLPAALRQQAKSLSLQDLLFDGTNASGPAVPPPVPTQTPVAGARAQGAAGPAERGSSHRHPSGLSEVLPALPSEMIAPLPAAELGTVAAKQPLPAEAPPAPEPAPAAPAPARPRRDTASGLPSLPEVLTGPMVMPDAPAPDLARPKTGRMTAVSGSTPVISGPPSYPELGAWVTPSKPMQAISTQVSAPNSRVSAPSFAVETTEWPASRSGDGRSARHDSHTGWAPFSGPTSRTTSKLAAVTSSSPYVETPEVEFSGRRSWSSTAIPKEGASLPPHEPPETRHQSSSGWNSYARSETRTTGKMAAVTSSSPYLEPPEVEFAGRRSRSSTSIPREAASQAPQEPTEDRPQSSSGWNSYARSETRTTGKMAAVRTTSPFAGDAQSDVLRRARATAPVTSEEPVTPAEAPAPERHPSSSGWGSFGRRDSRSIWGVVPPEPAAVAEPRVDPRTEDPRTAEAEWHFEKGLVSFQRHHWAEAVAAWEQACQMAPENKGWAFNLERARQKVKEQGDQGK